MIAAAVRLGSKSEVSGGTARAFVVVPQSGDSKDDEIYRRGLEIERALADEKDQEKPSK